ncbi:MAG: hypothetical protein ACXWV3_09790 [Flavisolibacter sp.]
MKKNAFLVNCTLGALLFAGSLLISIIVIEQIAGLYQQAALSVKTSLPGFESQLTGRH